MTTLVPPNMRDKAPADIPPPKVHLVTPPEVHAYHNGDELVPEDRAIVKAWYMQQRKEWPGYPFPFNVVESKPRETQRGESFSAVYGGAVVEPQPQETTCPVAFSEPYYSVTPQKKRIIRRKPEPTTVDDAVDWLAMTRYSLGKLPNSAAFPIVSGLLDNMELAEVEALMERAAAMLGYSVE